MLRRDFSRCPRCGAPTQPATAISGLKSEGWLECTACNTFINTYIPQAHQEAFHRDSHKYTGNFGGYGTGKTTTSREEFYKHLFITPGGNTLIGARVNSQYEQTIKRDIDNDLPANFVKNISTQKAYVDFTNGHRLMYRPFDDEGKLRSYNLSMFIMVEASEVDADVYTQLKTRNRNMAATVPERDEHGNIIYEYTKRGVPIPKIKADWRRGVVESNPDSGWIRTEVLLSSEEIVKHGNVLDEYFVDEQTKDAATSSHVAASDVNQFLPENFIREVSKNKPLWWINRYIKGSFSYSEGLVYPLAMNCVVQTYDIPKSWKRIIAFDYGLSDDAVYLFGAIDPERSKLVIYREVRVNNRSIEELSNLYWQNVKDIPNGAIWRQLIDPKSVAKRDYVKKSLGDYFLDYGIAWEPGFIGVEARVYRTNTYIESGKVEIMDCCTSLLAELRDYKYPARKLGQPGSDKPEDKNNHGINPLEWMIMALPADPGRLMTGIYNGQGIDITKAPSPEDEYRHWLFTAGQSDSGDSYSDDYGMIDYGDL